MVFLYAQLARLPCQSGALYAQLSRSLDQRGALHVYNVFLLFYNRQKTVGLLLRFYRRPRLCIRAIFPLYRRFSSGASSLGFFVKRNLKRVIR